MKTILLRYGPAWQQQKQKLQQMWLKREPRERKLLTLLAVLLVVCVAWYGVWQPLTQAVDRAETQRNSQQQLYAWVAENTARVERLRGQERANGSQQSIQAQELNAFISRTAGEFELEVSRLQPQTNGVLVVFNEAGFDQLLGFLSALDDVSVQVDAIDIAETSEPGVVRVRRLQLSTL